MSVRTRIALAAALLASGALIAGSLPEQPPPAAVSAARPTLEQEWPGAARADLRDLTVVPQLFLDATTAVGTVTDGNFVRLVVEKDGVGRELRRLPAADEPRFEAMTVSGDELIWAESSGSRPVEIWAVRRDGGDARLLTADTGNTLFYGNQYDLVVADGRVYWVAGEGDKTTQIRSVALTGGDVKVREEQGRWAQSAWPWLTDDTGAQSGTVRMRDQTTGRDVRVPFSGAEWGMCGPAWCRVMVMNGEGLARIDLMRPDGSDRRRIAGPNTQAAVSDVAVLDRFEILSEPGPEFDVTGVAGLIVHDLRTGRTVTLSTAADLAATKDGVLWWSTGTRETAVWHTLDLRTI
jgi:hypothetical protein